MSRLPHVQGVQKIREALREWRILGIKIREIKKQAEELPTLETQALACYRTVFRMLEDMDVKSPGNVGWESRVMWFLDEMDGQALNEHKEAVKLAGDLLCQSKS